MPTGFPPQPAYPIAIDSDRTLFLVFNTSEAKTTVENTAWQDEIEIEPVLAGQEEIWAENGFANISGELFYYDAVEKNEDGKIFKFKRCARNIGGKQTRFNPVGTWVRGFVIAEHHNQLVDATLAIEDFFFELEEDIAKLENEPLCTDDAYCVDVLLNIDDVSEGSNCEGRTVNYEIVINGTFDSFSLDFGDGQSTSSAQSGSHVYAPGTKIDPVVTVTSANCTVVQTPLVRLETKDVPETIENPPFVIPIPQVPTFPEIQIPGFDPPPLLELPQIVFPCLDVQPGSISIPPSITIQPPVISVSPPSFGPIPLVISIPSVTPASFVFGPAPNFSISPATFTFGPAPNFSISPATFTFGPAPSITPATFTFGPAPNVSITPASFVFGPAPNFSISPATFTFGPAPSITPATFTFGPAPTLKNYSFVWGTPPDLKTWSFNWGTPPTLSTWSFQWGTPPTLSTWSFNWGTPPTLSTWSFNWGTPPTLSTWSFNWGTPPTLSTWSFQWGTPPELKQYSFNWGTPPTLSTWSFNWGTPPTLSTWSFNWGTPPDKSWSFNWGNPPDKSWSFNWGNPPDKSWSFNWGNPPDKTWSFEWGSPPKVPDFEWGSPPSVSIEWGNVPTLSCTVTVECGSGGGSPFRKLDDDFVDDFNNEDFDIEINDLGIPSEIKIAVPRFPEIKIAHNIPEFINVNSDIPQRIVVYQADPIPKEIRIINESVPSIIRLDYSGMPESIKIDSSGIPEFINLVALDIPEKIRLDGSEIPETIRVVGVPDSIEVKMPSEIVAKLQIPENLEIPLVYKGGPVPIQFDASNLSGGDDQTCFALVPCKK